jgi:hypothetical protein
MLCFFVDTEIVILTLNVCVLVFLLCVELNINVNVVTLNYVEKIYMTTDFAFSAGLSGVKSRHFQSVKSKKDYIKAVSCRVTTEIR